MFLATALITLTVALALAGAVLTNRAAGRRHRTKTLPVPTQRLLGFLGAQLLLGVAALLVIRVAGGPYAVVATIANVIGALALLLSASRIPPRPSGPQHQGRVTR